MRKLLMISVFVALAAIGLNDNAFAMGQAPKTFQLTGKVAEVNLRAMTVKVAPRKGDSVMLKINEDTKLTKGGKSITLPNLRKDDQITVTYQTSWGKKTALIIVVQEQVSIPKKTIPAKNKR